jgi:hypothetical protein
MVACRQQFNYNGIYNYHYIHFMYTVYIKLLYVDIYL